MADYRLPMDADGFKYHGTVDQNEENPGQFMYGLDENGNKRIIRTDEQGNVLTRVTGSIDEFWWLEGYVPDSTSPSFVNGTNNNSYIKPSIRIRSSLDVDVWVHLRPYRASYNNTMFIEGGEFTRISNLIIPSGEDRANYDYIIDGHFPWLKDFKIYDFSDFTIRLQAEEIPAEGSLDVMFTAIKA